VSTSSPTPVPTDADAARQLELLFELRDLAGEAAAIDLDDGAGLPAELDELQRIIERVIQTLDALQALDDPDPALEWEELETTIEPDAWHASPRSRQLPGVADLSFAGGLELRRVYREMIAAQDLDARLVAGEAMRRKVRRAIRATLEAAREGGVDVLGGEHQGHHQVADLASGIAVRRLYARFRRALRRPRESTPEAVLEAVRYAGGALATLVTSADYADVRASDRAVLRRLRERALAWARHDRDVLGGQQLIDDLFTSGDLLRGINLRQELQHHDRELAVRLAESPRDDLVAWFGELDALFGMNDHLDAILDTVRTDPGARPRCLPHALACLATIGRNP
jgi:hypothetical protein